ncbi:MAG: hypothetical protein A2919_00965 [Candidatus Spechtbacteria bacterium RIFCSPLOWO2_01_FULL_43_12]|uniref:Uncharacterized protein n=1 Tax=Candidatus Spechtbacteria bacterium RIFCSPLOWO2_01_FULL_43_12 TaxID=1802162 RepID=A0A1G2HH08_9BACT|nr:MAG: hypothetical protein A2919_00965 [Candidatus Spechtbacteria bacterium RIFCSPLOWO2_01_FULL_43_12]
MDMLNLLPARIVLVVVILLIALFVLPEGIISKVPGAENLKNYMGDTFSDSWNTTKDLWQKLSAWIDGTAIVVRDAFNTAQTTAQIVVKQKLEAIEDIIKAIDAINRLLGKTPAS